MGWNREEIWDGIKTWESRGDSTHFELILLPVDNDGCDLLIHEDENDSQQGGDDGGKDEPSGVLVAEWIDEPTSGVGCGLDKWEIIMGQSLT